MDRMIYIGMTGASETALAQAVHSNNLANVSTTGFRADLARLQSLPVYGPGHPSRAYSQAEDTAVDFRQGAIVQTGRELDVAIQGRGWIAVQAADGAEAYTRAGDFRVDAGGILVTGAGYPVIGEGGPVAIPPVEKLEIGKDGTVSAMLVGQDNPIPTVLDRIRLVSPVDQDLVKGTDGLFRLASGDTAPADASVTLVPGSIESSNVNSVDALVNLIGLARLFEVQVKVMKTAEDNDAATGQLLRMG